MWTVGLYGLVFSNIIYAIGGVMMWVIASTRLDNTTIWSRYYWFLFGTLLDVWYFSSIWHVCNDHEYCFALEGHVSHKQNMEDQAPMYEDLLMVLWTSTSALTLFIENPKWFGFMAVGSASFIILFEVTIPGFLSGSLGAGLWISAVLLAWFYLTWTYVRRTTWFVGIWAGEVLFGILAFYFKGMQTDDNYYTFHFLWHLFSGMMLIVMVIGWGGLLYMGDLRLLEAKCFDKVCLPQIRQPLLGKRRQSLDHRHQQQKPSLIV